MAIALVTHAIKKGGGGNVTTDAVDTSGANILIVFSSWYASLADSTITDSKSNTWTALTKYQNGGLVALQMWYSINPTVGSGHTFTASNSTGPSVGMLAFSGADTSSPLDQATGQAINTDTPMNTGSITPGSDNEVIISSYCGFLVSGGYAVDSGMTLVESVTYDSSSFDLSTAYKIQTTAAAINPSWSWNSIGSTPAAANIASFKVSSGGGGGAVLGMMTTRTGYWGDLVIFFGSFLTGLSRMFSFL